MKIVQGYEEKNNVTTGMIAKRKKMFEEKLQILEKENDMMKEKTNKKEKTKVTRSEDIVTRKSKKIKGEKWHKVNVEESEFLEDSTQSSSKTFSSRRTLRRMKKHYSKMRRNERCLT